MKKRTLMSLLEQKNFDEYQNYLQSLQREDVERDDELSFFTLAPRSWLMVYVEHLSPSLMAERIIIKQRTLPLLLHSASFWGLYHKNLIWALEEGSEFLYAKIKAALPPISVEEAEIKMLKRKSPLLLVRWLDCFHHLGEQAERMLEERVDMQVLKTVYIEHQAKL